MDRFLPGYPVCLSQIIVCLIDSAVSCEGQAAGSVELQESEARVDEIFLTRQGRVGVHPFIGRRYGAYL